MYADVQGWHLYMKDMNSGVDKMKMNQLLATMLGPMAASGKVNEKEVEGVLKRIPVKFGQGKLRMPLWDVIPSGCYRDLLDALQEAGRR